MKPPISQICSLTVLLALVILLLSLPFPGRADVGIQPVLPGGSNLDPGGETPIQMAAERVVMTVRAATAADNRLLKLNPQMYGYDVRPTWYQAVAEVEADFTMRNPTDQEVRLVAWFPLASALQTADWNFVPGEIVPRLEQFAVRVEGGDVAFTVSELPNPQGAGKPALPWASFPLVFPANSDTLIHIRYSVPLQPSVKGNEVALYYVFQTGAGWAGTIGQAELVVNLPYPASLETISGISSLYLPSFSIARTLKDLPPGALLSGNQVRWTWRDFEPGPQDDFAIWLLRPDKWQELDTARTAVQAHPQDGQAWLELASVYHSLSLARHNLRLLFSDTYLPRCIQAYRKAAQLLPQHPVPQAALGLFALEPYLAGRNAPPDVLQYVQEQYQAAKNLEAAHPDLAVGALVDSLDLGNALSDYAYNDATATVEQATWDVIQISQTAEVTRDYATRTLWAAEKQAALARRATDMACWATAGEMCTATSIPTNTASPTITASPTTAASPTDTPVATPIPISRATPAPPEALQPSARIPAILAVIFGMLLLVGLMLWMRMRRQA